MSEKDNTLLLRMIKGEPRLEAFIRENGLSDAFVLKHMAAFSAVYDSLNRCSVCRGLFMCTQKRTGMRDALAYDGVLIREVEYCPYQLKENTERDFLKRYRYSDIPEKLSFLTLDDVELEDVSMQGLYVQLCDILEGKSDKGLYISGDLGVGKTYMCIGLANSLIEKGEDVAFVKVSSFINEMRRLVVNDPEAFDAYIRQMKEVKYLILDDIGSESVSSFSRDDVLFNILDTRMENGRTTLFTSNLSKADLEKHYTYEKGDKRESMRARRLLERIRILSNDYVLTGRNKRI